MSEISIGRRTKKAHSNEWTFFSEVTGGDRTHDNRNHNPGLYH